MNGANSKGVWNISFPVTMRATPSVTFSDNSTAGLVGVHTASFYSGFSGGKTVYHSNGTPNRWTIVANPLAHYSVRVFDFKADAEL